MSKRFRIALCLACTLLVAISFVAYGNEVRAQEQAARDEALAHYGGEVVRLVVSARTLEAGSTVQSSDVEVRDWLVDLAPQGALTSLDDVVGKTLAAPVSQGTPLSEVDFSDDVRSVEVPSGYVALSVPLVDKLGLTRETTPGTTVFAYSSHDSTTRLIASNLVVLSMPKSTTVTSANQGSCTLAVLPDDVARVLSASSAGELRLVTPADDVSSVSEGDAAQEAPSSVPSKEGDGRK